MDVTNELLFVDMEPEHIHEVQLPPGAYLTRLVDLDLESREAIGAFVERFGNPGHIFWHVGPTWAELQSACERFLGVEYRPRDIPRISDEDFVAQLRVHPNSSPYSIAEFRERARLLRDLTRLRLFETGELTFGEIRQDWEGQCVDSPPEHLAVRMAAVILNWSLSLFQPMVEVVDVEHVAGHLTPRFEDALSAFQPRLFEVLSLQLFNDIAAQATYRRCENPTCSRWYSIVPKGRWMLEKKNVALRSYPGARFCSEECTQMVAQREYRRRETLKRRLRRLLDSTGSHPGWAELQETFTKRYPEYHFDTLDAFTSACRQASRRAGHRGGRNAR